MVLGGLDQASPRSRWPTPTTTIANDGDRVSGTLDASPGPTTRPRDLPRRDRQGHGDPNGDTVGENNDPRQIRVLSESVANERRASSKRPRGGTGTHAQIGDSDQWGKTGTTENNGDAWFCGGDERSHRLRLGRLRGLAPRR